MLQQMLIFLNYIINSPSQTDVICFDIVQPGMYFQKVNFHVSGYNLRHTPHILILFFAHGYTHVSVHIYTQVTMETTTIISKMVYL